MRAVELRLLQCLRRVQPQNAQRRRQAGQSRRQQQRPAREDGKQRGAVALAGSYACKRGRLDWPQA